MLPAAEVSAKLSWKPLLATVWIWEIGPVRKSHFSGFALKLSVQRGYLQGYAAVMLFGVAVILLVIFL